MLLKILSNYSRSQLLSLNHIKFATEKTGVVKTFSKHLNILLFTVIVAQINDSKIDIRLFIGKGQF